MSKWCGETYELTYKKIAKTDNTHQDYKECGKRWEKNENLSAINEINVSRGKIRKMCLCYQAKKMCFETMVKLTHKNIYTKKWNEHLFI